MTIEAKSEVGAGPTQVERQTWRAILMAHKAALEGRKVELDAVDLHLTTRFLLEELENKGLRIVPVQPTKAMLDASLRALDVGKRRAEAFVGKKRKHRWRLTAAIEAAWDWRPGERADRGEHGLR